MKYSITLAFKPSEEDTAGLVFDLETRDSMAASEGNFIYFDDEDVPGNLFGFEMKIQTVTTRIPVSGEPFETLLHGYVTGVDVMQADQAAFKERVAKFPGVSNVQLVTV